MEDGCAAVRVPLFERRPRNTVFCGRWHAGVVRGYQLAREVPDEFSILVIASGEEYLVPVRTAVVTVGRWPGADICLPDRFVSRKHAILRFDEGMVTVEDLRSVNGTRIRNALIDLSGPTTVHRGDVICVGASLLVIRQSRVDERAPR